MSVMEGMTPNEELPGCACGVNIPRAVPLLPVLLCREQIKPSKHQPGSCATIPRANTPQNAPGAKAKEPAQNTFPTAQQFLNSPFHTQLQLLSFCSGPKRESEPGMMRLDLFPFAALLLLPVSQCPLSLSLSHHSVTVVSPGTGAQGL